MYGQSQGQPLLHREFNANLKTLSQKLKEKRRGANHYNDSKSYREKKASPDFTKATEKKSQP